jgi:ERCC4-type nuclease
MILVDKRRGSYELLPYLQALRVPVKAAFLDYGDFAIEGGKGPEDEPVRIGVERKTLGDLVTSMQSGRFTGQREDSSMGQLPGMLTEYDVPLLVVEGVWRPALDGTIEVLFIPKNQKPEKKEFGFWVPFRGQMLYRAIDRFLLTVLFKARVPHFRTTGMRETAALLADLHVWWVDKGYDEHKSHLANDRTYDPRPDRLLWREPGRVERVAPRFPGIGDTRAGAAGAVFPTVEEMVNAPVEKWLEVEGVGPTTAYRVWHWLREPGPRKKASRGRVQVGDRDAARPRYRKGESDGR